MRLLSFVTVCPVLGAARRVELTEGYDPAGHGGVDPCGDPDPDGRSRRNGDLVVRGVTPEEAARIVQVLRDGAALKQEVAVPKQEVAAAEVKADPKKAAEKPAAAKERAAPRSAPKAAEKPAPAAAKEKKAQEPPPELVLVDEDDEEPPADDEGDEEEGDDGEGEAGEDELLPVPDKLKDAKAKMRDVVEYLESRGYRTKEQLLQGCEALRSDVPILAKIPDMAERLERALQIRGRNG